MKKGLLISLLAFSWSFTACTGPDFGIVVPGGRVVTFSQPVEIKDLRYYKDGGTTALTIQDKKGQSIRFSAFAFPARRLLTPKQVANGDRSCIGADYPNLPGAIVLPRNGKEEKSILVALGIWANGQASRERQEQLKGRGVLDLSEKEVTLSRVVNVMGSLEEP